MSSPFPPFRSLLCFASRVLALLAGAAPLHADEPRWNATAECQMVTLPQKTALALLPELHDEAKIEAAFAKIQESIAKSEAQLVANLIAKTTATLQSLQQPAPSTLAPSPPAPPQSKMAVAESVEEIRYGTSYDPPQLPQGAVDRPEILEKWPHVGVVPTQMETRNVGATLEFGGGLTDDGQAMAVECVPSHLRLLRYLKIDAGRLPGGERLFIEQPLFHSLKNQCSLYLRNGQRVLVGMHKLPEPADTVELFFLRVSWTKVP